MTTGLSAITNIVVLMLENRSFDHMLGYLYHDTANTSPAGHPFAGLTGTESCPDTNGTAVPVFPITPDVDAVLTSVTPRTDNPPAGVSAPEQPRTPDTLAAQPAHLDQTRAELEARPPLR